jgi:hypothetical protein
MPAAKKKKVKKIRYKKINFKLSEKQKAIIDRYCKVHKTTANKLFKKAIKEYLLRNANLEEDSYYISENQLQLFDFEEEYEVEKTEKEDE